MPASIDAPVAPRDPFALDPSRASVGRSVPTHTPTLAGTHPYEKDERKAAVCHRINRLSTTQYRTEPSAVIAAVVLHNRMPSSDETGHAVKIQRMWRGVIARREFSDLFFAAVEEVLGPWLVPSGSDCDDDKAPKSSQRSSPSLEEAKLEAAYNPSSQQPGACVFITIVSQAAHGRGCSIRGGRWRGCAWRRLFMRCEPGALRVLRALP